MNNSLAASLALTFALPLLAQAQAKIPYGVARASLFQPPFRFEAGGKVIDVAALCVDFDGDSVRDLLFGT